MPYFDNDYPAVIGDNPRAVKVNKMHNGKRSSVATMTGVDRSVLASKPSLRINQNYLIEIDYPYVDLVMLGTATRLNRAVLADSTLGWIKDHKAKKYRARVGRVVNGSFERSRDLSLNQWQLLADTVFIGAKYPSTEMLRKRLSKAVDRAIALYPKLGLTRDRSDNARYSRATPKPSDRNHGQGLIVVDKPPKPKALRALDKRRSR